MIELKPCPFCGSEAEFVKHSYWYGKNQVYEDATYSVKCCNCFAETHAIYETEEFAIKAWNTRTPQKDEENMRQHHYVKIMPEYYIAVDKGVKTFEIRFNDRNYKVGDILHLQEFCDGQYTGRELTKEICYMIDSPDYCKEGYVVLGIRDF